ncbi:MAG: glyoxalase/bleomycin resistance/dioxygenase family protein [Nocardiopsaceae bacterium]|nr:glyoxalase/bleomycin resistance/dioxygenase family protein [Nocardiopsaceae bacterium]
MTHYSRLFKIVIDVPSADHDRELAFWSGATGRQLPRIDKHPEYHGALLPGGESALLVQRLEAGTARVHVDIHTDNLAAELARLEALGAERIEQVHSWWIMRDPAGLLFCVIPQPSGSLNDDNAHRWD